MTNRLIKAFFILAALLISSAAYSQSIVYTQGNVSIVQYPDTWQITHGSKILAHGNHVIDVENLAPPVQNLIEHYAKLPVTKKRTLKKSLLAAAESEEPEYLIKTHWDQGSPFNDLCPTIDGEHVPAGCVTISSAQVLNYYKVCKPLNPKGEHIIYANVTSPYMTLIEEKGGNYRYSYEYSYTPDFDKINSDDEEMAKFIFAVALSQKAYFDGGGSMTSYYTQCGAFDNRFGYDYDICEDVDKMKDFIIAALKEKRPVIVSDNARNHSYIIDGYNELNGNYHINFGWGESTDAWYTAEIVGISNYEAAIVVCPSDPNTVKMQEVPCYFYAKAKDAAQYTRYDMAKRDGQEFSYSPNGKTLHFMEGEYEYYFEYADGSTIAPRITDIVPLSFEYSTIVVKGKYQKEPATLKVKSPCDIDFIHDIQMGYIEIRGVNFNDPGFGTYNFVIEMDNKEIPLTYNEKRNWHETILELEPSQKEFYVKNKTTVQTIGAGPYPPHSITFSDQLRFRDLTNGSWLTEIDGSPMGLKILDNAIISDQEIPCKSILILIYYNGTYVEYKVLGYKAANNAMNHTLTLKADNSDYGEVIGAGSYERNSNVIVTALPKKGYCFYSWSDGNRNSTRNVLVDKDMELTAQFKKDEEVVHVNVELKGDYYNYSSHITGDGVYLKGETVLLKVNTELDFGGKAYVLTKWSDVHAENTRTFIAEEDITLTAYIECYNIPTFQKQFPKYLHIVDSKQNDTKYSFEQDNEGNVYSNISLRKGIYSFYYEYQDGKKAAPICGGTVFFNRESSIFFSRIMQESATVSFSAELDCNLNFYYRGDINYIYSHWPSYITISTDPKTEYLQGEEFSCADGLIQITYNNGTTETIALENAEITGFDNTKIGEQTITISYLGLETTLTVTVKEPTPISISVSTDPKTEYLQGEELSCADGLIHITYNNGTTETIALENAEITGFDNTKIGEQTLTVKYLDLETTLTVTVSQKSQPEPVPVSSIPDTPVVNVWSFNHTIYIESAPDTKYTIIDTNGRLITTSKTQSTKEEIKIIQSGSVSLIIGNQSFKLAL